MNAQSLRQTLLTPEEYLEMERSSPVKHEYVAGRIHAMTGTSDAHNFISLNLASLLKNHLRSTACRVFMADVKARLERAETYYYPDVMVSCEKPQDRYYREQPILIAEVLSPTTANRDHGEKWRNYQTLDSLREYVLISQDCMDVRVWRRGEEGWTLNIFTDSMKVALHSVGLDIPIENLYEQVWE